jgi:general stress protein 26
MHDQREIESKFWNALGDERTFMLGLSGTGGAAHARPMTALVEDDSLEAGHRPIWCFTSSDTELARGLGSPQSAFATFTSKGHDLFATIEGTLRIDNDRAMIERLWNPFVSAWFDGKDDPKVTLLRFEPAHAEVWLNEHSLLTGMKMLLGGDPRKDTRDQMADLDL